MVDVSNEHSVSAGAESGERTAENTENTENTANTEKSAGEVEDVANKESGVVNQDKGSDNGSGDDEEDGYDEDEDEDYVADGGSKEKTGGANDGANGDVEGDEDDDEEFIDEDDRKEIAKYSSIESSEGGLIKTRRQRLEEDAKEKKARKTVHVHGSGVGKESPSAKVDINSIWAELNSTSKAGPTTAATHVVSSSPGTTLGAAGHSVDEKVKITRTYEFAGKTISEEKWVDADSEEAKAHLNSTAIPAAKSAAAQIAPEPVAASAAVPQKNLRRKRKRASLLDAVITNSSNTKLTTLEKSRLDWATYVDKNKISDELKYTNKAGFLEKQDFLSRVDSRRDSLYSKAKSKVSKDT